MKIKGWHYKLAKDIYDDVLTNVEIGAKHNISDRQVERLHNYPEIQKEIDRLGEADTKTAIRYFQKNAKRAAKATVKLTETENIKDKNGKLIKQTFIQPGEVVRKASADILQALKIDVKGSDEKDSPNLDDLLGDTDNGEIQRRADLLKERARRTQKRITSAGD